MCNSVSQIFWTTRSNTCFIFSSGGLLVRYVTPWQRFYVPQRHVNRFSRVTKTAETSPKVPRQKKHPIQGRQHSRCKNHILWCRTWLIGTTLTYNYFGFHYWQLVEWEKQQEIQLQWLSFTQVTVIFRDGRCCDLRWIDRIWAGFLFAPIANATV